MKTLYFCRKFVPVLFLFTFVLIASSAVSAQTMMGKEKSLYERLGGYDALAAVTDDFAGRLITDKKLGKYFVGLSDDSTKKLRQHVIDFLCMATGGPCAYTGRDMKTSHTGLEITAEEWDISVKHLTDTLNKFKVPEKEKTEVLTAIGGLKKDIVEK